MNMNKEFQSAFIDGIQDTIHRLDKCNSEASRKAISGHYWYCLLGSLMDVFYNTTIADSFECSGRDSFRWIGELKGGLNPVLFSISKTKKKNVYAFHYAMLFKENNTIGKPIKFTLLENSVKRLCAEQYRKDGNRYNSDSSEIYKKIYIDSIVFFDRDTIKSKAFNDLKEALCNGIISMYQAVTSTCITTDYSDGVLMFPIEHEEELNKIFKHRDVKDGNARRSTIFSVVKEHTREGNLVERHVRANGFVYNGRNFGLVLGSDAIHNRYDFHDGKEISRKAIARAKRDESEDFSDDGLIYANNR